MKDFLNRYLEQYKLKNEEKHPRQGPVVTISRECGCSAKRIATKLSKILTGYNYLSETKTDVEWKWVSKEIVEMAAQELDMEPEEIKDIIIGQARQNFSEITSVYSTMQNSDAEDQHVIDTVRAVVRSMAEDGHYIIVGRAASIITQDIPNQLNIKLQAPLDRRNNRIMQISNLSWAEAQDYVLEIDRQRNLFVEKVAGRKLNNNDFDLIFNYSTMSDDHIVDVIVNVLKNRKIVNSEED